MDSKFLEFQLIDTNRVDLYDRKKYRTIDVHIWYLNVSKPCPIVIFSHALGEDINGKSYDLCPNISNQGYVVVSISHTYACKPLTDCHPPYSIPLSGFHYNSIDKDPRNFYEIEIDVWIDDINIALVECLKRNDDTSNILYNKIDFTKIGIMGHSLGGSTAISFRNTQFNIKAIINLDGPIFSKPDEINNNIPILIIIGSSKCETTIMLEEFDSMWRKIFDMYWLPDIEKFKKQNSNVTMVNIGFLSHKIFYLNMPNWILLEIINFLDTNLNH